METHLTVYIDAQDAGAASTFVAPTSPGVQRGFQVTIADLSLELLAALQRHAGQGKFSAVIESTDGKQYVIDGASVIGAPSTKSVELHVESGGWGLATSVKV